jgi:hypothetical protein
MRPHLMRGSRSAKKDGLPFFAAGHEKKVAAFLVAEGRSFITFASFNVLGHSCASSVAEKRPVDCLRLRCDGRVKDDKNLDRETAKVFSEDLRSDSDLRPEKRYERKIKNQIVSVVSRVHCCRHGGDARRPGNTVQVTDGLPQEDMPSVAKRPDPQGSGAGDAGLYFRRGEVLASPRHTHRSLRSHFVRQFRPHDEKSRYGLSSHLCVHANHRQNSDDRRGGNSDAGSNPLGRLCMYDCSAFFVQGRYVVVRSGRAFHERRSSSSP